MSQSVLLHGVCVDGHIVYELSCCSCAVAVRGYAQPRAAPVPTGRAHGVAIHSVSRTAFAAFAVLQLAASSHRPRREEVTECSVSQCAFALTDQLPVVCPLAYVGDVALVKVFLCHGDEVLGCIRLELAISVDPRSGSVTSGVCSPYAGDGISHSSLVTRLLVYSCSGLPECIPVTDLCLHIFRRSYAQVFFSQVSSVSVTAGSCLPGSTLQNAVAVGTQCYSVAVSILVHALIDAQSGQRSGVLVVVLIAHYPVCIANEQVNVRARREVLNVLLVSLTTAGTNVYIGRVLCRSNIEHCLQVGVSPAQNAQSVIVVLQSAVRSRSTSGVATFSFAAVCIFAALSVCAALISRRLSNRRIGSRRRIFFVAAAYECSCSHSQSSHQSQCLFQLVHWNFPP